MFKFTADKNIFVEDSAVYLAQFMMQKRKIKTLKAMKLQNIWFTGTHVKTFSCFKFLGYTWNPGRYIVEHIVAN